MINDKVVIVSGASPGSGVVWQIALWAAQAILAVLYGIAGVLKTTWAPAELVHMGINYAVQLPLPLLRFIGTSELMGAIGVLLPALTRILPFLTPVAAIGLTIIQVLAIGFHIMRGETSLLLNIVLLSAAIFVTWGRLYKAPIQPRTAASLRLRAE